MTTLAALLGFALSRILVRAVRWLLLWEFARAERDPYFNREYARSPTAAKSARKKSEAGA